MIPKIYVYNGEEVLYRAERGHTTECNGHIHVIKSYVEPLECQCKQYTLAELLK
jgi:hypothetical protein